MVLAGCAWAMAAKAQDVAVIERGKALFGVCAACHPTAQDGSHAMGPNLRGVLGRKPGSVPGFRFSKAMAAQEGAWDKESLDAFLENPMKAMPNNAMPYPGVKNAADRKAVVEYLTTLR
jgi:cytochrome c